jgi:hypothetical protein
MDSKIETDQGVKRKPGEMQVVAGFPPVLYCGSAPRTLRYNDYMKLVPCADESQGVTELSEDDAGDSQGVKRKPPSDESQGVKRSKVVGLLDEPNMCSAMRGWHELPDCYRGIHIDDC